LPDAKIVVSFTFVVVAAAVMENIKTHLAACFPTMYTKKLKGDGKKCVLPTFRRHINTYYRLFELVNEAAAVAPASLLVIYFYLGKYFLYAFFCA